MSQLQIGAAKSCITPPESMMPAMSFLPIELEGVYSDIFVRALVVDNAERRVAMVVFESGDMGRTDELYAALEKTYGLCQENVFFTVTHTHEAPSFASEHESIRDLPEKLDWVKRYGDFVIKQAVACVGNALKALQPCRWAFGKGESYINVCRDQRFEDGNWDVGRDFTGPSDKELDVFKFVNLKDELIAAMINYPVHGTACFFGMDEKGERHLISGDLPGMTSAYLEERYAATGAVFLWTSGAAGNQAPILFPTYARYHHDGTHDNSIGIGYACWALCEHLAHTHAIDVARVLGETRRLNDRMRIATSQRTLVLPGTEKYGEVSLQLKQFAFDDVVLFGIGGEISCEIGIRLKECSSMKDLVIIEHIAERIDYLPDRFGFLRQTFEGKNTRVKDGCAEAYITAAMLEMIAQR